MIKAKALIITVLSIAATIGFVYIFLVHTKLVLGILVTMVGLIGVRLIYLEVLNHLYEEQKKKESKWNKNK